MLSKHEQQLRSKDIATMTDEQLDMWINACDKMEGTVRSKKARRAWRESATEALKEKNKRTP